MTKLSVSALQILQGQPKTTENFKNKTRAQLRKAYCLSKLNLLRKESFRIFLSSLVLKGK